MDDSSLISLVEIGTRFNCDKFTRHHFGAAYERHFCQLRHEPLRILEIGIGGEDFEDGGTSLKTWEEYFHQALVFGIDIYDKSFLNTARIKTIVCDQGNQEQLIQLSAEHGPFDIIIDDGSHINIKTLQSLFALFQCLKPGGLYIVEDVQTAYWPQYGGSSLMGGFKETTMTWLKTMMDCVNAAEILWPNHPALRSGFSVEELHAYHNITFLKKAVQPAVSAVLTEELRREWLRIDMVQHACNESTADLLNNHPSLLSAMANFVASLEQAQQARISDGGSPSPDPSTLGHG